VAEKIMLVIKREYVRICSVVTGSSKVLQYYSGIVVEDLRNKRSIELIIGFGSVTFSIVTYFLTIPE